MKCNNNNNYYYYYYYYYYSIIIIIIVVPSCNTAIFRRLRIGYALAPHVERLFKQLDVLILHTLRCTTTTTNNNNNTTTTNNNNNKRRSHQHDNRQYQYIFIAMRRGYNNRKFV